jgi:hypothetical protein
MSYHRSVYLPGRRRMVGMGDAASVSRAVSVGGSIGASAATAVIGSIAANGGTIMGLAASSLLPVVGPIIGAAVMGLQMLIANSGCGQTCIVTSQWANQAAGKLQQILDGYFALPAPRTQAQQAVALAAFDSVWQVLNQQCSQPGTGDAGVRCITDRQSGACTWKQKYAPVYPNEPEIGQCWNWFNGYRDPIAKDPVVPDPTTSVSDDISSVLTSAGSSSSLLPLAAILALVALGASL